MPARVGDRRLDLATGHILAAMYTQLRIQCGASPSRPSPHSSCISHQLWSLQKDLPLPPGGFSRIGACGPGRVRARVGFWGSSLRDQARSRTWWPPPAPEAVSEPAHGSPVCGILGRCRKDGEEDDRRE